MDYRKEISRRNNLFKRFGYLSFSLLVIMIIPMIITIITGSKIADFISLFIFIFVIILQIFVNKKLRKEQELGFYIINNKAVANEWTVEKETTSYFLLTGKKKYEISEQQYNKLVKHKNKNLKPLLVINSSDIKHLTENSKNIEFPIYNS